MTMNVHNAITRNPKKANKILFQLCQEFDSQNVHTSDSSSESDSSKSESEAESITEKANHFVKKLNEYKEHSDYDEEDF